MLAVGGPLRTVVVLELVPSCPCVTCPSCALPIGPPPVLFRVFPYRFRGDPVYTCLPLSQLFQKANVGTKNKIVERYTDAFQTLFSSVEVWCPASTPQLNYPQPSPVPSHSSLHAPRWPFNFLHFLDIRLRFGGPSKPQARFPPVYRLRSALLPDGWLKKERRLTSPSQQQLVTEPMPEPACLCFVFTATQSTSRARRHCWIPAGRCSAGHQVRPTLHVALYITPNIRYARYFNSSSRYCPRRADEIQNYC